MYYSLAPAHSPLTYPILLEHSVLRHKVLPRCPLCCWSMKHSRHSSEETPSPGAHRPAEPTASLPWCWQRSWWLLQPEDSHPLPAPGTGCAQHCSPRQDWAAWSTGEQDISTLSVSTALPADYPAALDTPNCNTATTSPPQAPPPQAPTDSCIQTAGEATEQLVYV